MNKHDENNSGSRRKELKGDENQNPSLVTSDSVAGEAPDLQPDQPPRRIVGYLRRWAYEGKPCPPKIKNAKGRWQWPKESRFNEFTSVRIFENDVPLIPAESCDALKKALERIANSPEHLGSAFVNDFAVTVARKALGKE